MSSSVSAIIRTYNRVELLKQALESVFRQELPATEIVVVDDASTDKTPELMSSLCRENKRIHYVQLSENHGMYRAAKIGLDRATSELIAFLDSDDIWLPNHLRICAEEMRTNPRAAMAFSRYGLIDAEGSTFVSLVKERSLSKPPLQSLLFKTLVVQPTRSVYRRRSVMEVGGMPTNDIVGDWVLNVLMANRFQDGIVQLPHKSVLFRVHGDQSYGRPEKLRDALLESTQDLFRRLPPALHRYERKVTAINLLQSAIFFWQAGKSLESSRCVTRAIREWPACLLTRDFFPALLRLGIPASMRPTVRAWRRKTQRRMVRYDSA